MGPWAEQINKALLPLHNRAIISHIIEKFPAETEYVIAVGHLQEQVRQYLAIAHPDRKFIIVQVRNYDGPGSGPGHSLRCCHSYLERPFYFVSCDTLWDNELPAPGDHSWLGVAPVPVGDTPRYCNLRVDVGRIGELRDKVPVTDPAYQAFVGLCYIYEHQVFWEGLERGEIVAGEHQVSSGLRALIARCEVQPQSIVWTDVGTAETYGRAVSKSADYNFSKSDEFFYTVGSKVIKYFVDSNIAERRVARAALNPDVFPTITDHAGGFYAYTYQPGDTLYQCNSPDILRSLLCWLDEKVWRKVTVDQTVVRQACQVFYKEKTLKRLEAYRHKYAGDTQPTAINGENMPPFEELLGQVPWGELEQGVPSFIHGDLQFDNILYDQATRTFKLLDWRQDFAGHTTFGDLYYDLAKMRGGIIVNYDYIKRNLLNYREDGDRATFDFAQRYQSGRLLDILDDYVRSRGLDVDKVGLLAALIYLNMAPLHHYPFDKMLHALGHVLMAAELGRRA